MRKVFLCVEVSLWVCYSWLSGFGMSWLGLTPQYSATVALIGFLLGALLALGRYHGSKDYSEMRNALMQAWDELEESKKKEQVFKPRLLRMDYDELEGATDGDKPA